MEGLTERTNWMDYPAQMEDVKVLEENPLAIIKSTEIITHVTRKVQMAGKRTYSKAMETEEEENSETIKRQKTKTEGQLVEVTEPEIEKKEKGSKDQLLKYKNMNF